jgi:hypothetical protein
MAAKLTDITKYDPKSSDIFFFDNNVWMYLFCPLGNYNKSKQKHYSSFLQSVTTSRSTIFISSMVLSEFSNRNLRMDFDLWKDETGKYGAEFKKDYVGTSRYKNTVEEIKVSINSIMKCCDKTSDNFNAIDIGNVLVHLSHIDFNDSYYIELAKLDSWKIVTDDNDFLKYTNHNIEIITLLN